MKMRPVIHAEIRCSSSILKKIMLMRNSVTTANTTSKDAINVIMILTTIFSVLIASTDSSLMRTVNVLKKSVLNTMIMNIALDAIQSKVVLF